MECSVFGMPHRSEAKAGVQWPLVMFLLRKKSDLKGVRVVADPNALAALVNTIRFK